MKLSCAALLLGVTLADAATATRIETTPGPARVLVSGEVKCAQTPCDITLGSRRELEMRGTNGEVVRFATRKGEADVGRCLLYEGAALATCLTAPLCIGVGILTFGTAPLHANVALPLGITGIGVGVVGLGWAAFMAVMAPFMALQEPELIVVDLETGTVTSTPPGYPEEIQVTPSSLPSTLPSTLPAAPLTTLQDI